MEMILDNLEDDEVRDSTRKKCVQSIREFQRVDRKTSIIDKKLLDYTNKTTKFLRETKKHYVSATQIKGTSL